MKVDINQIAAILYKHVRGEEMSAEEGAVLEGWRRQSPANNAVFEQVQEEQEIDRYLAVMLDEQHTAMAFQQFKENKFAQHSIPVYRRWWAAAAVLLILAGSAYFFATRRQPAPMAQTTAIHAGGKGAILTLANGAQILLDTIRNGSVALQGGAVAKVANGRLTYEGNSSQVVYNKVATPNAREFQLVLPDGTQVWLNAASAIRYPTAFAGNERKVEITGEAYFEVAKNEKMPFLVEVNHQVTVEVLGTHFNINAYGNEDHITTTLLEGAVKVIKGNEQRVISPGEQAQVNTHIQVAKNVDMDKVMAWKNGLFNFEESTLAEIMRQLERWYDIEVVYEKNVPDIALMGELDRRVPLNDLLPALGKMGVHYRLEGRKLIIMP